MADIVQVYGKGYSLEEARQDALAKVPASAFRECPHIRWEVLEEPTAGLVEGKGSTEEEAWQNAFSQMPDDAEFKTCRQTQITPSEFLCQIDYGTSALVCLSLEPRKSRQHASEELGDCAGCGNYVENGVDGTISDGLGRLFCASCQAQSRQRYLRDVTKSGGRIWFFR